MLLQKLPNVNELDADAWNRMNILANTVTNDELKNLNAEALLRRIFSEENMRLFDAKTTQFRCSCSKSKVGNMLRLLGKQEVESILAELGKIEVNCDFCNKQYRFDAVDAGQLLASELNVKTSAAKH